MEVEGDGSGDLPMFTTTLANGNGARNPETEGAKGAGGAGAHDDGDRSVNESCQGNTREMDRPSSPSGGLPMLGASTGGDAEIRGGLGQAVGNGGLGQSVDEGGKVVVESGRPGVVHAQVGGESEGGCRAAEGGWGGGDASRGGGAGGESMTSDEAREMLRVARARRANAEAEVRGMAVRMDCFFESVPGR